MPDTLDNKRIAFLPLKYTNAADMLQTALVNEFIIDPNTAAPYFKKSPTEIISFMDSVSLFINDALNNGTTNLAYIVNNNRFIYRFYYAEGICRLDRHLTIPAKAAFYRIRDIGDANKYYVHKLTHINQEAISLAPFVNNQLYFVEFYNVDAELISQVMFTAKFAPGLILNNEDADKVFSHLQIVTNKDKLVVGEDIRSLLVRLYSFYEDGTYKDVSYSSATYIDLTDIDINTLGVYESKATYIYDLTTGSRSETTYPIEVIEDTYATLWQLLVLPRKIITLNDNTKEIRLSMIAYFDDGTIKNVTDECVVSNNFNDELFNVEQTVTIRFNVGRNDVVERNVSFTVYDSGAITTDKVIFGSGIIAIDDTLLLPPEYKKFRVRHPMDLNFFYTINYIEIGYSGVFADKSNEEDRLHENMNVIVEFYDENNNLLTSRVFTAKAGTVI